MQALFLDFDGTIADSMSTLYQTYLTFLERRGIAGTPKEFAELNGYSMKQIFEVFQKRYGFDARADLTELHQKLFLDSYRNSVPLFEGTQPFLEQMSSRGVRMAIVTAATEELVEVFLERYQIAHHFEEVITPDGLSRSKPDPAIYLRALDLLGLKPEEAVTVEDSIHGISASLAANIPTIAISHSESIEVPAGVIGKAKGWTDVTTILEQHASATAV